MSHSQIPRSVAIIMDGNGRWAQKRERPRTYGHLRGAYVAKKIITHAAKIGIENLTLFTFSSENWFRPIEEVNFLMQLLARQVLREQRTLMKNNIRFHSIGQLDRLPDTVRYIVEETIEVTRRNTGLQLVFALSYGGRQEIVDAAKNLAAKALAGEIVPEEIDESMVQENLESHFIPQPDLIIRTSGENRLSNFMLWQAAYSELLFVEKPWPEFTTFDFDSAIKTFAGRNRRFGRITTKSVGLDVPT